jgi:dynein heavy chain
VKADEVGKSLVVAQSKLQKELQCDKMMLNSQINSITSAIAGVFAFNDISQHMSNVSSVRDIQTKLDEALEKAQLYNMRERLCALDVTDYSQLRSQHEAFAPYKMFWEAISTWRVSSEKWRRVPLSQLSAQDVESQFAALQQQLVQSLRVIQNKDIQQMGLDTRGDMDVFRKFLPIFAIMLNQGMTEKHWAQLNELVGHDLTLTPTMTLNDTIAMNLHEQIATAQEISTAASNEHNIKSSLRKIGDIWDALNLEMSTYKETDWLILTGSEEVINQVDEHLVMLQAINFSQHKAPFEEEISMYTTGLQMVLQVLEKGLECRSKYLYLAPIFSSKDICHQLPHEGMRFQKIAATWAEDLGKARQIGNACKFCSDKHLFKTFKKSLVELEGIERALIEALETKRTAFPRFIFSPTKSYSKFCHKQPNHQLFNHISNVASQILVTSLSRVLIMSLK